MKELSGKIAVVTGGGTGMGRELVRQLIAEGCHVAFCDIMQDNMTETMQIATAEAPQGIRVLSFKCDVSKEDEMHAFANKVKEEFETDHVNLLFNNAGVGGGGSFVEINREQWEKTFDINWGGVYNGCLAFREMLLASTEGHLVNTSSVNGFWASLGYDSTHTAYAASKFAVKGFTEALINDFRMNAPHVKVTLVMPGHIGTSIHQNSQILMSGNTALEMDDEQVESYRQNLINQGVPADEMDADQIRQVSHQMGEAFKNNARTSAAEGARVIIDGVKNEQWRVLIGEDAITLDKMVRESPEAAYTKEFSDRVIQAFTAK